MTCTPDELKMLDRLLTRSHGITMRGEAERFMALALQGRGLVRCREMSGSSLVATITAEGYDELKATMP
jgi:hypothetical protein